MDFNFKNTINSIRDEQAAEYDAENFLRELTEILKGLNIFNISTIIFNRISNPNSTIISVSYNENCSDNTILSKEYKDFKKASVMLSEIKNQLELEGYITRSFIHPLIFPFSIEI